MIYVFKSICLQLYYYSIDATLYVKDISAVS